MRKDWRDLLNDVRVNDVRVNDIRLIMSISDINLRLGIWRSRLPKDYQWSQKISIQMLVQGKTKLTKFQGTADECVRRCEEERNTIVAVRFDDGDKITLLVDGLHFYD